MSQVFPLNNRNDRTTGTMERDRKRYMPIHLLCFAEVFFNLQTPTGRYGKCLTRTVPLL